MPHDYPIPAEYFEPTPEEPAMHMSEKKKAQIHEMIENMPPEKIERFLEREACERYLEPGLSDELFQAFVAKCTPKALDILRARLKRRGSVDGEKRLDEMIANLG